MPKKIKFESFKHQFLMGAYRLGQGLSVERQTRWANFIDELDFEYVEGVTQVRWSGPKSGVLEAKLAGGAMTFYMRGDSERFLSIQERRGQSTPEDIFKLKNAAFFDDFAQSVFVASGV